MEKVKKGVEMFSKLPSVAIAAIALAAATARAAVEVGNPGFPYSVPGSFLTVGRHENGKYMFRSASGLWIRNVSTAWREDVCRLMPSAGGRDLEVSACTMRDGWLEAKTGDARRDPAYTWTASAFLVLAHELEERQ